jgi:cephalosporin hydroxylase
VKHFYKDLGGWFKFRPAFESLVKALPSNRPSTFVEIGLWLGRSTAYLGVEILNAGKPISILAIDHFKGQPEITGWRAELVPGSEASFRQNIAPVAKALGNRFRLVVSDSVAAADEVPDDSVEVVWLDGAHDYDGVRRDIEAWWPKLRVGGFIGGDDFIKCVGVKEAVSERFGARAAVAETHYWLVRRLQDGAVEFL